MFYIVKVITIETHCGTSKTEHFKLNYSGFWSSSIND